MAGGVYRRAYIRPRRRPWVGTKPGPHSFTQSLTGTLALTGAQTRSARHGMAASLSFVGSFANRSVGKALLATLSTSGSIVRFIMHGATATVSPSSTLAKFTARKLTATHSPTGALATARIKLVALVASLSLTGVQTR